MKNAFVKALSSNGVAEDEIAKIRRDLGLSAEGAADKTLHERSLRPLTRQQVRQILDDNAAAINAHAEQIPGAARTKVQIVMSVLTQESSSTVVEGPATALDPEGKRAAFYYGGNANGTTRSFRLEQDETGGITIRFETTVRPANLLVGDEAIPLGAGSELKGSYSLTLSAEKLNALGELDFANCDHAAADQVMYGNLPAEQKLRTAVDRLPPAFRLNLNPTTSFSVVLN